jgi:hypothetical protein
MTTTAIQKLGASAAVLLAAALGSSTPAGADDDPPMHQVVYTISAKNPIYADIYYQDQDPTKYSDYSHNPYTFTPNIQADIAPGRPWTQQVMLINPDAWAMVSVSTGRQPGTPGFHCTVSVDGNVVVSKDGDKGVLCSLRTW